MTDDASDAIENALLVLLRHAMSQVGANVESIVSGGGVVSCGVVHMATDAAGTPGGDHVMRRTSRPRESRAWRPSLAGFPRQLGRSPGACSDLARTGSRATSEHPGAEPFRRPASR